VTLLILKRQDLVAAPEAHAPAKAS
jgi:hypothetical protein